MAKKKNQREQEQRQEVTQLLRQAANNGNLGQREFERILDAGGNANRILERAVANKGLTINSGVVNSYNKGKYTTPLNQFMQIAADRTFGPGFGLSPIIQQIRTAGKLDPKSSLFIGSRGSTATVLPRNFGAGGTKTSAPVLPSTKPVGTTDAEPTDYGVNDSGTGSGFDSGFDSGITDTAPSQDNTAALQGATLGGGDGMMGALGIKSKKSSRKQAGVSSKGTSQLGRDSLKIALNFS